MYCKYNITFNFLNGVNINNTKVEIICYMSSMICVGAIEEIIFRGFLFKMMEKDNITRAKLVSSLTFGIGHIINLLNGAGIFYTLFQICYAVIIGYLFVVVFKKTKSIWPCIITHSLLNAFYIFNIENILTRYIAPTILIIVSIIYIIYLEKFVEDNNAIQIR